MQLVALCVLSALIAAAAAYPWGTNSCGAPGHGSGSSTDAAGLSIKMDGSKVILSSTRGSFKGFYMKSDLNLGWKDAPAGTTGSKVCGGAVDSVLFHSNSNAKTFVAANIACTPGQSFSVTAYVVFSYASPFVILTSQVICGNGTGAASSALQSDLLPPSPAYMSHGIVFIVAFAVLMPLTSVLMLVNKAKFYLFHKVLGVIISVLVVAGGLILTRASPSDSAYASLAFVKVGKDHKTWGLIGIIIASVVCCLGVILWTVRLPSSVKPFVRYSHGILGSLISLYGPFVVWTGWIRLAPVVSAALDQTPFVWMSLAIAGFVIVVANRFWQFKSGVSSAAHASTIVTLQQIQDLVAAGHIIVLFERIVCMIPPSFNHPGGVDLFEAYVGQDISDIMLGKVKAQVRASKRFVMHSQYALQLVKGMSIGRLSGEGDSEMSSLGGMPLSSAPPLRVISDSALVHKKPAHASHQFPAQIASRSQINTAADFPVFRYKLQLRHSKDWAALVKAAAVASQDVGLGSRVYLTLSGAAGSELTRPYTSIHADARSGTIEFAIKHYAQGVFTSQLAALPVGTELKIQGAARPELPPLHPKPCALVMIAGGTGVTPMLAHARDCRDFAMGAVLLWWLRDSSDVFCGGLLDDLQKELPLKVKLFYTRKNGASDSNAAGGDGSLASSVSSRAGKGRISRQNILEGIGERVRAKITEIVCLMSGPPGFVTTATAALEQAGVPSERIVCLD